MEPVPSSDATDVRAVLRSYARAIDDRDWSRVSGCYHPDAIDDHGVYRGNAAGLVEHFRNHIGEFSGTLHLLAEPDLHRVDDDTIEASTYCLALHWREPGDARRHLLMVADYDDRFERREGSWKIARRTVRLKMAEEMPVSDQPWALAHLFSRPAPGEGS